MIIMNRLTFEGYLKNVIKSITGTSSFNMRELSVKCNRRPELLEPLALYAVLTGRSELCRKNDKVYNECLRLKSSRSIRKISPVYENIYKGYNAAKNQVKTDNQIKSKFRNRIIAMQKEKSITNYRIYTDLNLNHGNVNSFLKNEDYNKLSLETVRRIWKYLERI